MNFNTKLYEINTRVWIKKFGKNVKLSEVPLTYFENLKTLGFDFVWLMGVWKIPDENIRYALVPGLVKEYKKCLPDWKKEDVIGSPYAIDSYRVNPALGTFNDLINLKEKLNKIGLKLILDFIPNHFGADSSVAKTKPHLFLKGDSQLLKDDPLTYFRLKTVDNVILAHGRDPFFPAWSDTVQLNYFSADTRKFMTEQLVQLTKYCDGVRCDMAMLLLNNVFNNTWMRPIDKFNIKKNKTEFWSDAIKKVKKHSPDFTLIAEVYWDLEPKLLDLGFDYVYCKYYLDSFINDDVFKIMDNLNKDFNYVKRSVVFLENHDEDRAVTALGKKIKAAVVSFMTMPGMKLIYDGQLEGENIKYPIQLGRAEKAKVSKNLKDFYCKILEIVNGETYKNGNFNLLVPSMCCDGDESHKNILAWYWRYHNKYTITIVNYSSKNSRCKIKLPTNNFPSKVVLKDLLTKANMKISADKLAKEGFMIHLKEYQSRILAL